MSEYDGRLCQEPEGESCLSSGKETWTPRLALRSSGNPGMRAGVREAEPALGGEVRSRLPWGGWATEANLYTL